MARQIAICAFGGSRTGSRPSTLKKVGYSVLPGEISITEVSLTMTERFVSTCGQIGVMTKTPDSGDRIGPPAESEYAVEPVGVAMISPSALNSVSVSPFTFAFSLIKRERSPRLTTASFKAWTVESNCLFVRSWTDNYARLLWD